MPSTANVIPLRAPQTAPAAADEIKPRRSFGAIRKLPSGRFQAHYTGSDKKRHMAPVTFDTKADAAAWLAMRQAEIVEHRWRPPTRPDQTLFSDFADKWMRDRELSVRTRAEYERMRKQSLTVFEDLTLDEITPALVKRWFDEQPTQFPTARRRAYDLLRAILATATKPDEDTDAPPLLATNPARLSNKTLKRRAPGTESRPRNRIRPATLDELATIANEMPERYKLMVLLAAWCAPRFGELTELRRRDVIIDEQAKTGLLSISRSVVWPEPDKPIVKEPKSAAGVRDVTIPPHILPDVQHHLATFAAPGPDGLLFPAVESGGHMKHGALYKVFRRARAVAGRPDLRWHDLRHTGATMAAQAGATLADLMSRLGHSNINAALIYQHAAQGRDAEIAKKLSEMAKGD